MLYWDISAYWRYILPIALWLLWEKVLIVSLWGTLSLPGLPVTLARCWILMNRSSDPPPGPVCQPSSCHKQPQKSKPRQSRRHVQRPGDSKSATPHPSEGFHCGHGHGWTRVDTSGHEWTQVDTGGHGGTRGDTDTDTCANKQMKSACKMFTEQLLNQLYWPTVGSQNVNFQVNAAAESVAECSVGGIIELKSHPCFLSTLFKAVLTFLYNFFLH